MTFSSALLWAALAAAPAQPPAAGAVTTPALPPMPTAAQCKPLGPPRLPLAFGPGEQLDYDLDALGAKAGRMTMSVLPLKQGQLPVEVKIESNTFFSKVRRVKGLGASLLNPKTLRPTHYSEDATENEVHRVAEVTFRPKDHAATLVSSIDGRTGTFTLGYNDEALDVAGTMYLLRQLDFKEGATVCVDVYGIRGIWRVWGKVLPREHASMPLGEFGAWHLEGQAARLDSPSQRRGIHVWISDDARRLPLAAVGMIDLGAVRATLTGFTRPGEKAGAAENKANLKW